MPNLQEEPHMLFSVNRVASLFSDRKDLDIQVTFFKRVPVKRASRCKLAAQVNEDYAIEVTDRTYTLKN